MKSQEEVSRFYDMCKHVFENLNWRRPSSKFSRNASDENIPEFLYLIFWKSMHFDEALSGVKVLLRQLPPQPVGGENLPSLNWRGITRLHLGHEKSIPVTSGFTTLILTTVPRTEISLPVTLDLLKRNKSLIFETAKDDVWNISLQDYQTSIRLFVCTGHILKTSNFLQRLEWL